MIFTTILNNNYEYCKQIFIFIYYLLIIEIYLKYTRPTS